jgi:hypothetical protein
LREAGTPPEAPLPAPYESPWRSLSRSLLAVVADLRLRLRRLWRLRPWLVIALALGLVVVLLLAGFGLRQLLRQAATIPIPAPEPMAAPAPVQAEAPAAELPRQPDPAPMAEPMAPAPAEPELPSPAPPELDPLLAAFAAADPGWIAAATASPGRDLLTHTLAAAPPNSPDPRLQRRLERWQELAQDLGYGNLEVSTSEGRLLARSALVGSGMILLDSAFLS